MVVNAFLHHMANRLKAYRLGLRQISIEATSLQDMSLKMKHVCNLSVQ